MDRTQSEGSLALIQELIEMLKAPDAPSRLSAAQALGERGEDSHPAVGALLRKAMHDPDATVRLEAAMALYKIGGRAENIVPLLMRAVQDADEARCWVAVDCLGEIGPAARDAVPILREALQRPYKNTLIHKGIAIALEKIGTTTA